MIRMAEEEEQEGKNPPSVLLVEAISADDKDDDDSSLMRMMMTTNVCAYISYSYDKVINFAARAVQTWEPLDDDASMMPAPPVGCLPAGLAMEMALEDRRRRRPRRLPGTGRRAA